MHKRIYTPKNKYADHKNGAAKRGIPFLLTFEEWWDIWQKSGHWGERGPKKGQYVMSRCGPDIGPYAVGNVFIQTSSANHRETDLTKRKEIACNWEVTDPKGNTYQIFNLAKHCREHNLVSGNMGDISRGSQQTHRGWRCKKL